MKYLLDRGEIDFMRSLRRHEAIGVLADHASVDIGVVTGKNEFFVLDQEQVKEYELEDFVIPLVGRSVQLSGAVLRKQEHEDLARQGKRVHLLHLNSHRAEQFTPGVHDFIAWGEQCGFNTGYKCRIRDPWYNVPSVWEPDCFFFRQIYDFPRVVVNKAGATSTDTIHRMKCKGNSTRLAGSLYTHLTAASAEIEGRSYGGGVLELEPTEAERLLVPKRLNGAMSIEEADRLVRQGRLADVLEHNDRVVLQDAVGLSKRDCRALNRSGPRCETAVWPASTVSQPRHLCQTPRRQAIPSGPFTVCDAAACLRTVHRIAPELDGRTPQFVRESRQAAIRG